MLRIYSCSPTCECGGRKHATIRKDSSSAGFLSVRKLYYTDNDIDIQAWQTPKTVGDLRQISSANFAAIKFHRSKVTEQQHQSRISRKIVFESRCSARKNYRKPVVSAQNQKNYFSGVECKDEVYAAHQLACVKYETSPTPKVIVEPIDSNNGGSNKKSAIEKDGPPLPIKTVPQRSGPIAVTAKLFSSFEPPKEPPAEIAGRPHTATKTIFAPRTEDMSKGFLTFSEEEPGLTSKYRTY